MRRLFILTTLLAACGTEYVVEGEGADGASESTDEMTSWDEGDDGGEGSDTGGDGLTASETGAGTEGTTESGPGESGTEETSEPGESTDEGTSWDPTDGGSTDTTGTETWTTDETTEPGTTMEPGPTWYSPCASNADCPSPLVCTPHTMDAPGRGHCTGSCDCATADLGSCGSNTCPAPGGGNVGPWCSEPYTGGNGKGGHCWLFTAGRSCASVVCPEGLVCYEGYEGPLWNKAFCAAP